MAGFGVLSEIGLEPAEKHVAGLALPLETRAGAYLLVEATSGSTQVPLDDILGATLEWGMEEEVVLDGALAASRTGTSTTT